MDTLKQIIINDKKYYFADDLINLELSFFNNCTNGRRIVDNKKLSKK
jgi:hypothetical protein